ncbi:MAG: saccharopine dehydrogenase C-terminal domain-containing protein, partial [Thermoanaerobaculum sp.]
NEGDLTVMVLKTSGVFGGKWQERSFFLYDRFDPATGLSSMARSTGFTATAVLRALMAGYHCKPGVLVPEVLGQNPDLTRFVVSSLRERGLAIRAEDV